MKPPFHVALAFTVFAIGAQAVAQPGNAATEFNTVPKTSEESLARIMSLTEKYQHPKGREANAANGYDLTIDAIKAIRDVDVTLWRTEKGETLEGKSRPCFDCIYGDPKSNNDPKGKAVALEALQAYEKAGVFQITSKIAAAMGASRPKYGSEKSLQQQSYSDVGTKDEWDGKTISMLLPELGKVRGLARIQIARMHVAFEAGDTQTAAKAFEETLAVGRVVSHQWTLIDRLVGFAVASIAMNEARQIILDGQATPPLLAAFEAGLSQQLVFAPMSLPVAGEKVSALDSIRWIYTGNKIDPKQVNELQAMSGNQVPFDFTKLDGTLATPSETAQATNAYFAKVLSVADSPRRDRKNLPADLKSMVEALPPGQIVLRLMAPNFERSFAANDQFQTQVAGLRAMIALEQHRLKSGSYPKTLAELKGLPPAMLDDAFGDGSIKYKVTNPKGTTSQEAYVLYSVGIDGADNDGKPSMEPFAAFNNAEKGTGFDFVLNGVDGRLVK